ncbi:hypothetical protein G9A89_015250 [Geosiphon pyriformis]|nr:hypothetical protein G9A89_015250 [Geosiphon pyriformis]
MEPEFSEIPKTKDYRFYNWAKTFSCKPELYFKPATEDELINIIELARNNHKKIKVVGAGHSPSDLACTTDYMINLDKLNHVLEFDQKLMTVTVEAGIRLHQLNEELKSRGLALGNLGSISDQSVAGAISTATHGTGINYGVLSSLIIELTLILSSGARLNCSQNSNPDIFKAALCGVGSLGIITRITIQCEPRFRLEAIQKPVKLNEILDDLDNIVHSAEHVRFWWFPHTDDCVLWKANRSTKKKQSNTIGYFRETLLGFHLYQFILYFVRFQPTWIPSLTRTMFKLKFTKETFVVDDSYKVFNFDCLFPQYVNEWAIPWERTKEAIKKIEKWIEETNSNVHFPIEVRFVDEDDIWLSPAFGRKVCYIGIIMYRPYHAPVPYKKYWAAYEEIMRSCQGRPHWAKAHTMTSEELTKSYPKFQDFQRLREKLDPDGMFLNPYLRRHFLGEKGTTVDSKQFSAKL